jgi:hypothetical protein
MHVYTYNANLPYYMVSRPTMSKRHSLDLKKLQEGHFCGQIWWSAFAVFYRRTDNPTGKIRQELQKRSFLELGRSAPVIAWNQQVKCSSSGQIGRCKPEHPDRDPARHLWSWRVYPVFSGIVPAWKTEKSLDIQESRSFSRCCFHSLWQALLANIREYLIWTGKGTWVSGKSEIQLVDSIGERELFCISTSCHRSQTCSDHVQQCQFLESYLWSTLSLPSLLRSSSAGTKDQVVRPASSTVFGLIKSYHILSYHTVLYYLIIPYLNISQ